MNGARILISAAAGVALAGVGPPAGAGAQASPACSAPERQQLEFWVGDWEVVGPNGQAVGLSRVEFTLDSCAVREEWRSGDFMGVSLNAYDAPSGQWRQLWTDNTGAVLRLSGSLRDGGFVYEGERRGSDGKLRLLRVHLTVGEDGYPQQRQERSEDGGATWSTTFEGQYRPRSASN